MRKQPIDSARLLWYSKLGIDVLVAEIATQKVDGSCGVGMQNSPPFSEPPSSSTADPTRSGASFRFAEKAIAVNRSPSDADSTRGTLAHDTTSLARHAAIIFVSGIFLVAAWTKTASADSLVAVLEQVLHVPIALTAPTAAGIVLFEFFISGWLICGYRTSLASIVAAGFLVLANCVLVLQIFSHSKLGCGCGLPAFGISPESGQVLGLVRNCVLILALIYGGSTSSLIAFGSRGPFGSEGIR